MNLVVFTETCFLHSITWHRGYVAKTMTIFQLFVVTLLIVPISVQMTGNISLSTSEYEVASDTTGSIKEDLYTSKVFISFVSIVPILMYEVVFF